MHRVEDVTELMLARNAAERDQEFMRSEVLRRSRELAEANHKLRQAVGQFEAVYDQGLFAARLAPDGTVLDANRACVEGCGLRRDDILGKPFWDCGWWNRDHNVIAWVRDRVMRVAATGEVFRGESRYFWGDGAEHVVDFACMPIKDPAGRVQMLLPTGMDVTERVQGEANRAALEAQRRRAEALSEIDRAKTAFFLTSAMSSARH